MGQETLVQCSTTNGGFPNATFQWFLGEQALPPTPNETTEALIHIFLADFRPTPSLWDNWPYSPNTRVTWHFLFSDKIRAKNIPKMPCVTLVNPLSPHMSIVMYPLKFHLLFELSMMSYWLQLHFVIRSVTIRRFQIFAKEQAAISIKPRILLWTRGLSAALTKSTPSTGLPLPKCLSPLASSRLASSLPHGREVK